MAQWVKDLPAMWETWVQSLGWDDHMEKRKSTDSSILVWRNSMDSTVHGVPKSRILVPIMLQNALFLLLVNLKKN